jgi:nitroimidazol reductase NimA-like FMN-containing flavoprotein (pyridoxamine 5'-phosphate oxidase superfamily)
MRRTDREITDFDQIADIVRRADTLRLGFNGDPYPYVVPLSYGFTAEDGKLTFYIHGAREGLKYELLAKNDKVCAEIDIFHRYAETAYGVTAEYESVIGFGQARIITGAEAVGGLDLLLAHCGYADFAYDKAVMERVRMIKIELASFTGKRRFVGA